MLTPLLPLLLAAAPDAAALRAQAQAAYTAKQYAKACPLFEQVTKLLPEDGSAWADLSLCLFRAKKQDGAVKAALQSLRFGDEQTRKSTYFNLGKFADGKAFSKDDSDCQVAKMPACEQTLWLCGDPDSGLGKFAGGGSSASESWEHLCSRPSTREDGFVACTEIKEGESHDQYVTEQGSPGLFSSSSCSVVAVDPCAKRLGLTCEEAAGSIDPAGERKTMEKRTWVEERTFTLPEPQADAGT